MSGHTETFVRAVAVANLRVGRFVPAWLRGVVRDHVVGRAGARPPSWRRRQPRGTGRPRVRVGFVGAGEYAQNHLEVLADLEGVELSALLTTGGPRGRAVAQRLGIDRVFDDRDAFLSQDDLDCLVVVVPSHRMRDVASACLQKGLPVLMEKPPGLTSADTAGLARAADAAGTWGMVAMNRRYYSVLEHGLAALAACGPLRGAMLELPQPITVDRQSGRLAPEEYEHFMVRNSIHGIDLLRYVLGEPVGVHSLARPNTEAGNTAASFASILECDGGAVATITDLWDTPPVWRLKVVAEQGWLELQPLERGWFVNSRGSRAKIPTDPIDRRFRPGIYAQDLAFVTAVRAGRPPALPACLLPDAERTMALVEAILAGTVAGPGGSSVAGEAEALGELVRRR